MTAALAAALPMLVLSVATFGLGFALARLVDRAPRHGTCTACRQRPAVAGWDECEACLERFMQ